MIKRIIRPDSLLLAAGIALLPVYLSKSGGVQPAHLILALFAGSFVLRKGVPRAPWALSLLTLAGYISVVEVYYSLDGWTYLYNGKAFLPVINAIFFLYTYVIAVAVYGYCRRSGLDPVRVGVLFATAIALVTVLATGVDLQYAGAIERSEGSFNNPNQLGFFSVCLLSMTFLLYRHGHLNYIFAIALFFSALFLSVASLSRAAVFANLVVFFLVLKPRLSRSALFLWGIVTIIGISLIFWLLSRGAFDDFAFVQRFYAKAAFGDSSLEGRGYFVFMEASTAQLVFGLGAENVHKIVGHEVHSTVVSVLSNYGLVGLFLFGSVLFLWCKRLWSRFGIVGLVCIAGPAMLYGLTHNGTRFTFFWVLFATSLAAASSSTNDSDRRAARRPRPQYATTSKQLG